MKTEPVTRSILYKGTPLTDFAPQSPVSEVISLHVTTRPELVNAVIEGPVLENGVQVYTVQAKASVKG